MIGYKDIIRLSSGKQLERFIDKRFKGQIPAFLEAVNNGFNGLLRSDIKKAGKFLDKAKELYGFLPDSYLSRLLAMEARFCQYSGDNATAARKYESALKLNLKYRDFAANARLRKGLMNVYMYLGKYHEALKAGKLAFKYFEKNKLKDDAGQILNNIGNVYFRMDRIRPALRYYDRARDIFRYNSGIPRAIVEFNRGNVYSVLNQLSKAKQLYEKSEKIYAKADNQIAVYQIQYSLAIIEYWENKFSKALATFENVIDRLKDLGDPRTAVIAQLDLVELNIELNLFSNAVYLAEDILAKAKSMGMNYELAKAHYLIAKTTLDCGDLKKSGSSLKLSEKYFKSENNQLWLGLVNFEKGRLYCSRGLFKKAENLAVESKKLFYKSGDKYRYNNSRILLIEIYLKSKKLKQALRLAGILLKERLPKSQRQKLYYLVGCCRFAAKDYADALKWLRKSITMIEQSLEIMYSDEIRFFYATDKYNIYKLMIECLLNLGKVKLSYLNSLKALQIINMRPSKTTKWQKKIPKNLVIERDNLRAALKKIHRAPDEYHRRAIADTTVFNIEQKLWLVERKIRNLVYSYSEQEGSMMQTDMANNAYIGKEELLLNFLTLGNQIGVFVISTNNQKYIALPVTTDELQTDLHKLSFICERAVYGFDKGANTSSDINYILNKIYSYLFEPIEPDIAKKDIILLANGDFIQVPFAALRSHSGAYLKDLHRLCQICDPADLENRTEGNIKYDRCKNAVFAAGTQKLPSAEIEAHKIARIFKSSNIYINSSANRTNLLYELNKSNGFLHIAAHAARSSENPLFSKIILDDGPLFPFDIYGMNLKPTLITLSGCHTAAPGLYYGNTFSLAKSYYQAGCRFVLASLWPVSDKISSYFMIHFYRALSENNDVALAYKEAVDITSETIENPALWGAFVVLGI